MVLHPQKLLLKHLSLMHYDSACQLLNIASASAERIEDLPISAYERLMNINYFGVLHSVKSVLPDMLKRQQGHFVFISSSMGLLGKLSRPWLFALLKCI